MLNVVMMLIQYRVSGARVLGARRMGYWIAELEHGQYPDDQLDKRNP